METKQKNDGNSDGVNRLYERLYNDSEVREYIELADVAMAAIGYTEHGMRHVSVVAENAARVLTELGHPEEEIELARVAGLLHDIGNIVAREGHEQCGALLAYPLLRRLGFSPRETGIVLGAIGNHEEERYPSLSAVGAALTIADKADVHRSRVRDYHPEIEDIHDDVNYACVESKLIIEGARSVITLDLTIDAEIATVMEYFQIFTSRMMMARDAANYLGCEFHLVINGTELA
ncbi:MAG: hypothetical protein A2Y63_01455 [Candidatus Riflebacteria bacterium RBG_13_59_9]|nr:MAG: hypothetical protein A2Y63_01455 [Candidatus Riflebacteria bacterium RBG_13_59_9]